MDVSVSESSAEVGSSQSTIDGCGSHARAEVWKGRRGDKRAHGRGPPPAATAVGSSYKAEATTESRRKLDCVGIGSSVSMPTGSGLTLPCA
eukprot:1721490-Pleurochrysis_carterae.AAC.2